MAKRLIDIAPYENMVNATVCQIQVYRSGNGFCDVMNFKAENIPTVDAVEVVRCAQCKHLRFKDFSGCCQHMVGPLSPDGYCDRGERKEG